MRAAIYARYSSDLQRAASIADQERLCRALAARRGDVVVDAYADAALSGAHAHNRPGLQRLLADAKAGRFDVVLAEALDRLSRDLEDIAGIAKRLAHAGVALVTEAEGQINELHVGLKGTMNALFLKDLAAKIRRGQSGRAAAGRAPGGLSYGYRVVRRIGADGEIERGLREIDEAQARIVRRVFAEYAQGLSPRAIAAALNAEGVPAPRGRLWRANTIIGNRGRRDGLLHNELYIGRLLYNRVAFRKDPDTGRRVTRLNPESEWVAVDAPALRILDDEAWAAAQAMRRHVGAGPRARHARPKRLLSGLIRCGVCGAPYTLHAADRYACSGRTEHGACANGRVLRPARIEAQVLAALRARLLSADAFDAFAAHYRATVRRLGQARARAASADRAERREVETRIARLVQLVAGGTEAPASARAALLDLERRKAALDARLAPAADIVALLPNLESLYRRHVAALEDGAAPSPAARTLIRGFVEEIRVHPTEGKGGYRAELTGNLASLMAHAADPNATGTDRGDRLVAVEGSRLYPPIRVKIPLGGR